MTLYSDDNPGTTIKGLGFKDAKTAKATIKKISNRSIIYQQRI